MSDKQTEIIDTLLEAMKTPGKWERMRNDSHNHCNYETLRAYRGMNSLLLAVIAMDRGYKGKQRLTFKQIQKLGGLLKK